MAIALVQQHTAGMIAGDPGVSPDTTKPSSGAYIAWPVAPTSGNTLILWQAVDDDQGTATARSGWTEIGTAVVSTDFAGSTLRVWRKIADGTETQHGVLDVQIGDRVAFGVMEFSGITAYDTTTTSNMAGGSLGSATVMPSLSITPSTGTGLLVFIGMVAYVKSDGTQELTSVSQSGSIGSTMEARNQGERPLQTGTYGFTVSAWQGHAIGLGTGARASVPTLTWFGGGTTIPSTGCQQRAVSFS